MAKRQPGGQTGGTARYGARTVCLSRSRVRAFDQTGNISNDQRQIIFEFYDTKIGHQSSER